MAYKEEMLSYNKRFVENKEYERFLTTKYPERKVAILTCMDTRLSELLPAALHLKNGDAKIIKNAGAVITQPFGSVMRSLLVCVYDLGVKEIFVIGHRDCGMQSLDAGSMTEKMLLRGITPDKLETVKDLHVDMKQWLKGFKDPAESVRETLDIITSHPLFPSDVACSGFLMDPVTGELEIV